MKTLIILFVLLSVGCETTKQIHKDYPITSPEEWSDAKRESYELFQKRQKLKRAIERIASRNAQSVQESMGVYK